jgi:hypothetical protein
MSWLRQLLVTNMLALASVTGLQIGCDESLRWLSLPLLAICHTVKTACPSG